MHALNRLIANAVNYTPAGSVTISTARVVEAERTWVTLSVTDTGPGITPEDLPHIFERFYRGRAAADYKTPGAGIGLSISREIAERLGGRLTVRTQVGVGSTFTLWLPASPVRRIIFTRPPFVRSSMNYQLQDLIDLEQFQNLQDRLNEIYSFPSAIVDNEGHVLTATAWQAVCTQFHRKNQDCERDCLHSDQYILSHLHEANPAVSYRCPRGLVDNATPIIIDGVHYGNFFTGQFFLEAPDMEFFRLQARQFGFDEAAYLEAVNQVPIWTKDQLNSYLFSSKG